MLVYLEKLTNVLRFGIEHKLKNYHTYRTLVGLQVMASFILMMSIIGLLKLIEVQSETDLMNTLLLVAATLLVFGVGLIVVYVFSLAQLKVGLAVVSGETISPKKAMPTIREVLQTGTASLLATVVTVLPILLAVLVMIIASALLIDQPVVLDALGVIVGLFGVGLAIYFAISYVFCCYLILDQKISTMDSLRGSWHMVKGARGEVLIITLVLFLLALAVYVPGLTLSVLTSKIWPLNEWLQNVVDLPVESGLELFFGLMLIPVVMNAGAHYYREIAERHHARKV